MWWKGHVHLRQLAKSVQKQLQWIGLFLLCKASFHFHIDLHADKAGD
jgi:hypothetical protein